MGDETLILSEEEQKLWDQIISIVMPIIIMKDEGSDGVYKNYAAMAARHADSVIRERRAGIGSRYPL